MLAQRQGERGLRPLEDGAELCVGVIWKGSGVASLPSWCVVATTYQVVSRVVSLKTIVRLQSLYYVVRDSGCYAAADFREMCKLSHDCCKRKRVKTV